MAICLQGRRYSRVTVSCSSTLVPKLPLQKTSRRHAISVSHSPCQCSLLLLVDCFPPLRLVRRFWRTPSPQVSACGHSGFLLHTVTRFLWPELHHYYGFICHPTCHASPARIASCRESLSKKKILSDDTGLPQLMSGFPVEYAVLNHCVRYDQVLGFALFCTLTSPPQPYLVRFRYVHSTSYGFLQTLSLPITPLPFGLSSPWSG